MKKIVTMGFIIMLLMACDKEKEVISPEIKYLENILAGQTTGTGILYTDIPNDTLFFYYPGSSDSIFIDINNDGIDDFELYFVGSASPAYEKSKNTIRCLGDTYVAASDLDNNLLWTLSLNDTIDNNLNWVNDTCIIYNHFMDMFGNSSTSGLWNDLKNKHVGTKILLDDQILYGWIKIEIPDEWNLCLLEYACTIEFEE